MLWLEAAHALAAVGLGAGKRDIGVAQQRGRGVAVARRERDADACGAHELLVGDADRTAERLDQAVGEGHHFGKIADIDKGHGEFVDRRAAPRSRRCEAST